MAGSQRLFGAQRGTPLRAHDDDDDYSPMFGSAHHTCAVVSVLEVWNDRGGLTALHGANDALRGESTPKEIQNNSPERYMYPAHAESHTKRV